MGSDFFNKKELPIRVENIYASFFLWDAKTSDDSPESFVGKIMHIHSYAEIFCCVEGEISIKTEGCMYDMVKGDVAIVPSGLLHVLTKKTAEKSEWRTLGVTFKECFDNFSYDVFSPLNRLCLEGGISLFENEMGIVKLMMEIYDTQDNADPYKRTLLLSEIYRLANIKNGTASQPAESEKRSIEMELILKIDDYINSGYKDNLTIKQIAEKLFVSERHLSRVVKRKYGESFHSLLLKKRTIAAAQLLSDCNEPVDKIGKKVGFSSKMGFYREFKKIFGVTPAEYRKITRE